jgi:hypothetical protein
MVKGRFPKTMDVLRVIAKSRQMLSLAEVPQPEPWLPWHRNDNVVPGQLCNLPQELCGIGNVLHHL